MTAIHSSRPYFPQMPAAVAAAADLGWQFKSLMEDQKQMAATQPQDLLPLFMDAAPDMEYLVMSNTPLGAEFFAEAKKLRHIAMAGSGIEHYDLDAATKAGVSITNAAGGNARAVAELTLGSMFAMFRFIPQVHGNMLSGGWRRIMGWELGGKTLGILGLGAIGLELAALAKGIGMRVIANSLPPYPEKAAALGIRFVDRDELFSESDVISLHLPSQGKALIGEAEIAKMKPGSCLCNFARGDLVDLDALAAALKDGHLRGAALDTFPVEPPDYTHPLFSLSNVVFTPHMAGSTWESHERVAAVCVNEFSLAMRCEESARCVNPAVYRGYWRARDGK